MTVKITTYYLFSIPYEHYIPNFEEVEWIDLCYSNGKEFLLIKIEDDSISRRTDYMVGENRTCIYLKQDGKVIINELYNPDFLKRRALPGTLN